MTEWEMKYHHMNKVASDLSIGCARLQGERDRLRKAAQIALEVISEEQYVYPYSHIIDLQDLLRKELGQ